MSPFWQSWMKIWCGAVIVFGAVLASGAFPATDGLVRTLYDVLGSQGRPDFDATARFSVGLMGAVTLGWGLTLGAVIDAAHRLGERAAPVWRMITVGIFVWYVIDGAISIATGFALNAVSNTALLAGYLVPVMASGVMREPTSLSRA